MSGKKTEKVNPKRDEEAVIKNREDIKKKSEDNAEAIKSGELIVLIEDDCHLLWGDACSYIWGRKGEPIPIPVLHQKERYTYYGVIHYLTKEFILKPYDKGDGLNTVDVIQCLRDQFRGSRLLFIWEGASDHKCIKTQDYLNEINEGLEQEQ